MATDAPPPVFDYDIGPLAITSCEAFRQKSPERVTLLSGAAHPAVYAVSDVLFLGGFSQALCPVSAGGTSLALLQESWAYGLDDLFASATLQSLRRTAPGTCRTLEEAAPVCFVWEDNFWHWMFEGLARVALLESLGYRGAYIIPPYDHALETMVMLQIPRQRLVMGRQPYRVKRLVVTEHMAPDTFAPGTIRTFHALKERLDAACSRQTGTKRCYIKRIGRRKVANEPEVTAMLESLGFAVMTPEDFASPIEQLAYMSNVECSVMAHGANAALAFAQPRDAHFFELFGMGYVNNCNGPMAEVAGLHHHQLVEKTAENAHFDQYGDFTVDVDFLRSRVRRVLALT
ncbi:MAG: hypothetical protein DELT_01330 [Desulfovibrio sp.]